MAPAGTFLAQKASFMARAKHLTSTKQRTKYQASILWTFTIILYLKSSLNTMCALYVYIQERQTARVDGGLEGDDIDRIFLPPLSVLAAWLFLRGGGPSSFVHSIEEHFMRLGFKVV